VPLDPGRHWLEAGITGLARPREWDGVATVAAPGAAGGEAVFVALEDGRLLVESGPPGFDAAPIAAALDEAVDRPYRAVAVRRAELGVAGAATIEVVRLDPDPPADDLELSWDGSSLVLLADGLPVDPGNAAALERLAVEREHGRYAARAHRLERDLWEVSILPL
jgi:hypothetical protein